MLSETGRISICLGPGASGIERTGAQILADALASVGASVGVTTPADPEDGDIVVGTPRSSPLICDHAASAQLASLGEEGFLVEPVPVGRGSVHAVAANEPRGVLYGCAALADRLRLGERLHDARLREKPVLVFRNLWSWTGAELREDAFFRLDLMREPHKHDRFQVLGRYLAQARINSVTFWPHPEFRPDMGPQRAEVDEAFAGMARWLRESYGIDSYLFVWYEIQQGTKVPILGWPICPFDERVIRYWHQRLERLFRAVPDLTGLVMAGAGGDWVRGPWECQCHRCRRYRDRELLLRAMEMICGPWRDRGIRIIWKAVTDRPNLVGSEVAHFADIDNDLPPYAMVAHKPFYKDFRPPSPLHPLLYIHADQRDRVRPYVLEFQIYGEYRGSSHLPCVMIDRWGGIAPMVARKGYAGLMGIASFHSEGWDHPLNLANFFAFGRYAWNPQADPDAIYREWAALMFGPNAADEVIEICRMSYRASVKMMFFRGTMTQNHSKLPTIDYELESSLIGPWHDLPKAPDGYMGRGHDVSMYPPEAAEAIRGDPNVLLWAHQVPITPELCDEAIAEKREAWELIREMAERWERIPHDGWEDLHRRVSEQFRRNLVDAELWYEDLRLYFDYKAGRLTRSELARRIADIEARFDLRAGSGIISETFEPFINEWKRVLSGNLMRRSMEGRCHNPKGEPFLPGLKDG